MVSGDDLEAVLNWCHTVVGPVQIGSDKSKTHGGHESGTFRLQTAQGMGYLKVHQTVEHWQQEVHAYEQWAGVFGSYAPRLVAVREERPLALIVSELPGEAVEQARLTHSQKQLLWHTAGQLLAALHDLAPGICFGPCLRNGSCAEAQPQPAEAYVSRRFQRQIDKAIRDQTIDAGELSTIQAALALATAFAGERPLACHRDYCAANWLVDARGNLVGVIDFEFAYWDVRVADFSRDPNWNWIHHPDLVSAFFVGYGRTLSPAEEKQLLVAHTEYALGAINWGNDYQFYGFVQEGHEALAHLAALLT